MRISKTNLIVENIKSFIMENLPDYRASLLEESVDYTLPDIAEWKTGYLDVFSMRFYPCIIIGVGKTTPSEMYSDFYDVDIVFCNKNGSKEELIKQGYLYSDILYHMFRSNHSLGGVALNTEVLDREHFEGDEIFISNITLRVEVEEGEYKND